MVNYYWILYYARTASRIRDLAARLAGGDRSVRDELSRLLDKPKPRPEPTPTMEPAPRDPMADYHHPSWRRIE